MESAPKVLAPLPATAPSEETKSVPSEKARGDKDVFTTGANSQAKLKITLERYAINHPAALQATLEKSPESVKPALRQAIATAVAGYEKALMALD